MTNLSEALRTAIAHHQAGRLQEAAELYQRILAADARHAEAMHLLGVVAHQTGQHEVAIDLISKAVQIDVAHAGYRNNLGEAYRATGQLDAARRAFVEAIRLDPQLSASYFNLAMVDLAQDDPQSAERRCREALARNPNYAEAHNLLGTIHHNAGHHAEALACYEQAIALAGAFPNPHYHRGLILLAQGRLAEGWPEFEWRFGLPEFPVRAFDVPRWRGQPLPDRTLLVHVEQGLGDTLQFVRYLPIARGRCRRVVLLVQPQLVPLLRRSGIDDVYGDPSELPKFDYEVPIMSLPGEVGTTLATIPADVPYLSVDAQLVDRWRDRLRDVAGFRIGINWQGNPGFVADRFRSIPLAAFAPLARVPGVRLVSLQRCAGLDQLASVGSQFEVLDLRPEYEVEQGAFLNAAAVMRNLDLVITSDTAIPHLAGALGVPVWVALGTRADWRWFLDRSDSPWYPTMRLFRTRRDGDWSTLMESIATELAGQAAQHARKP